MYYINHDDCDVYTSRNPLIPKARPDWVLDKIDNEFHFDSDDVLYRVTPNYGVYYGRLNRGYVVFQICRGGRGNIEHHNIFAHHIVFYKKHGYWPTSQIDHGNRLVHDNSIDNIECVDHSTNMLNANVRRDNASSCAGVSYHKARGKWRAYKTLNGRNHYLGYYYFEADAIAAVRRFCVKHNLPFITR